MKKCIMMIFKKNYLKNECSDLQMSWIHTYLHTLTHKPHGHMLQET